MKEKNSRSPYRRRMTCGVFLCCMWGILLSAMPLRAQQEQTFSVDFKNKSLTEVFDWLASNSSYVFTYNSAEVKSYAPRITRSFSRATIGTVLTDCLEGSPYTFELLDRHVVIKKRPAAPSVEVKEVRGKVTDEKGQPLPGVTVLLKGTTVGVVTGNDGRYKLILPGNIQPTLLFSFIGMKTREVIAHGKTEIDVIMQEDVAQMDEVVVTGYQTISKERATGAYSMVSAQTLEQKPSTNISSALNGLVPGLTVTNAPVDGSMRFAIRGRGTLSQVSMGGTDFKADNDPLIVVDGFPISGYSVENDPFSTINPNDVESVTVLKDAAATSIYGARAANGVIVITTKKGKGGKLEISADAFWSVSSQTDLDYLFNMASAENQFRFEELMHKYTPINLGANDPYLKETARRRYMSAPYGMLYERDIRGNLTAAEYEARKRELIEAGNQKVWKDDLREYMFRRMMHQQYNVALRGATERLNYAFSASYDEGKSYLQGNSDRRVLLNLNSSARLTKNLTFELGVSTTFDKEKNNGTSISEMRNWLSPWTRLTDDEGNFVHIATARTVYEPMLLSEEYYAGKTPVDWTYNPVADRAYLDNYSNTMNYRVQGGFDYKTTWGLNVSAKGQYEQRRYDNHTGYEQESFFVRDLYNTYSALQENGKYKSYFPAGGIFSNGGHTYEAYNLRGQVDYSLAKDEHSFNVLAGSEIISAKTEANPKVTRYGYNRFTNAVVSELDYVTKRDDIFGNNTRMPYDRLGALSTLEDRFFSVYANASYTYDDRYSLTASFRTDASNFQAEDVRDKFSPFWSVGASWLISNEKFMQASSSVDLLKLRASYGIAGIAAGKQGTSSVTTVSVYSGNLAFSDGEAFNRIAAHGNNTLTWEKSRTLNIGVDMAFFGNKLNGSVEFYNKYSYDVLASTTVPVISQGTTSMMLNNAEILNRGVEFSIGSDLPVAGDLRWNGMLNYSYNSNKLKKFHNLSPYMPYGAAYMVGHPIGGVAVLKPVGYTPEGYVLLEGKDGTQQAIMDMESSHMMDFVLPREGQSIDTHNWGYYLGSQEPTGILSFSNRFTWKGLTLSFMITGQFGYYFKSDVADNFTPNSRNAAYYSKRLDKAFRVYDEGYAAQDSYVELPLYNDDNAAEFRGEAYSSTLGVAPYFKNQFLKGDHIRLNEVFLGYDLPQSVLAKQGVFSRINVYAQASNLGLIWSANGKMDPNYPVGSLKPMPTFTFGLKLGFKNWK